MRSTSLAPQFGGPELLVARSGRCSHSTIRKATDSVRKHRFYTLLQQLERARIHYSLTRVRDDTVMIQAVVPGRRYEIEVFSDGSIEVEIFGTNGGPSRR